MSSPNSDLQVLAARLDQLESRTRRWKLASIVFAATSTALILMAAKPADRIDSAVIHARTVEAQDFVVKDEDGQIRARLTLNPRVRMKKEIDSPGLNMNAPMGPALQFYNGDGDAIWTAPQGPTVIPAR